LHSAVSPSTENWISTGAGVSGLGFNYVATRHAARVELYIDRGDGAINQARFDHFAERRVEIEGRFGGSLDWQPLPGRRACRINADVAEFGYADESSWPSLQERMIDSMIRLEQALRPAISELT
jgi:hypothetical protein